MPGTRPRITLAEGAGHLVQWDRPELVIEAAERLMAAAPGRLSLPAGT